MDLGTLEFVSIFSFILALLGVLLRKDIRIMFPFIGGLLALFIFIQMNTDGSITNAYAFSGGFQTSTVGIWPFAYLPLFLIFLNWSIAVYEVLS